MLSSEDGRGAQQPKRCVKNIKDEDLLYLVILKGLVTFTWLVCEACKDTIVNSRYIISAINGLFT